MATISDMAFDYAMKRGTGKKAHENFVAGAKAVLTELQDAYNIGGMNATVDRINSFMAEFSDRR